jgi:ribosomal protein S18 acetylase RimI-like enzyme
MIQYTEEMKCSKEELANLFLSVNWNSGKYPDKLYESIKNSTYKIFAYDDGKLIGMISALSDECINLFISYLLVDPNYQNMKIGSILLNKLITIKDFNRIELITDDKDKDFYLKNGFIEDGIGMFKIRW